MFFVLFCLLLNLSTGNIFAEPLLKTSIWNEYEKLAYLKKKDFKNQASFELLGPSYDFKIARAQFATTFPEIRHITLITPEYQTNNGIIPIFLIKGTWVKDHDFCNIKSIFFQGFLKFAKDIARQKGMRVELITFSWKASNQNKDRKQAALRLAQCINMNYHNELIYPELYIIGHSHGGSVGNAATHFTHREITRLINLATPVRHGAAFKPSKYKFFYQFYIEGDFIQWLGAGGRTKSKHFSPRRYSVTELHTNKPFHCIFTKIDGVETDHYHIKLLSYHLADILNLIDAKHQDEVSLVVNVVHNKNKYKSPKRNELANKHPILLVPYIPKKHFSLNQKESNPQNTLAQKQIFKTLYPGKTFSDRSRVTALLNNITLFFKYLLKNICSLCKRACNPKLSRIPGDENLNRKQYLKLRTN